MAAKALEHGVCREQLSGDIRRYLDAKSEATRNGAQLRVYGEFVFIYGILGTLITCWRLPDYLQLRRT